MTAKKDVDDSQTIATDDLGIFTFAKRTGQLLIPMGIVAGLFGIWLKAEIATVRSDIRDAISEHARESKIEMVSRIEFDMLKQSMEERHRSYLLVEEQQTRQIHKNTMYLEAIGFKLGVKRNSE